MVHIRTQKRERKRERHQRVGEREEEREGENFECLEATFGKNGRKYTFEMNKYYSSQY